MRNVFKSIMLIVAIMAMSISVAAKSPEAKAVFNVSPKMVCANCENKIKSNLRFEKGISEIETSIEDETITITYNPEKTDTDKLAAAFQKVGYTATLATEGACTEKKAEGCCKAKGGCCKAKAEKTEGGCCKAKAEKADTCKTKSCK